MREKLSEYVGLLLHESMAKKLEAAALETGRSKGWLIREALREYLGRVK